MSLTLDALTVEQTTNTKSFASGVLVIASSGGSSLLSNESEHYIAITGTLAHSVALPDATTLGIGHEYVIHNGSTQAVTVKNNGGTTLATLSANQRMQIKLRENAPAIGVWDYVLTSTTVGGGSGYPFSSSSEGPVWTNDTGEDLLIEQVGNDPGQSAFIQQRKARGTIAAKDFLDNGDKIGGYSYAPWNGSGYAASCVEASAYATEDHDVDSLGSEYRVYTTPNGETASQLRMTVQNDGKTSFHNNDIKDINSIWLNALIDPPAQQAGKAVVFGKNLAGRVMPTNMGPSGLDYEFQPLLGRNKIAFWQSAGNSTSTTAIGAVFSAGGTTVTRSVATTSHFTWFRRLGITTSSTAGTTASLRVGSLQWGRGNAANTGGFFFVARCGISDASAVAQARSFVGMTSASGILTNGNPSGFLNILGFAHDSGQSTWRFMYNDGSGTASSIDMGASFPSNTLSTDMYEFIIFCPPNGSSVGYRIKNLRTEAVSAGSVNTDIPSATQLLAPQIWRNNGTTSATAAIDIVSLYIETDN